MGAIRAVFIRASAGLLMTLPLALPSTAAADETEIRAVVGVLPPFVIEEQDHLTGFSVELWNEVAKRLNARTHYQLVSDVPGLLDALRTRQADIIVSGLYYSAERDREFDFSYSILNAGQQVMVRTSTTGLEERPLNAFIQLLFSRWMLYWLVAALLLLLVPAHILWLIDRRNEEGISTSPKYFPGIFDAMAWAAAGLLAQAPRMPKQRFAHALAIVWLFTGVVFVTFFTAQMTATLTVEQIHGAINGPDDLPGKAVATLAGSASVDYLHDIGARPQTYPQPQEMYSALLSGKVDAVVMAAPALRYYAAHEGAGKVQMTGPEVRKSDLAFVVPLNSPLRRKVNSALVAIHDDGTYARLYETWFGKE
jgi:polar amino acid transport system substrate-binding protein